MRQDYHCQDLHSRDAFIKGNKRVYNRCKPQQVQTTSYTQDQESQIRLERLGNI